MARDWQTELARVPRIPDFFLVGAPKCGTTTVYGELRMHPRVFLPTLKEPHFFSEVPGTGERSHLFRPIESGRAYAKLYRGARPDQILGDTSTSYLFNDVAYRRIHDANPDARILIGIRDPVQRAFSAYLMVQRNYRRHGSFLDAVHEALASGEPEPGQPARAAQRFVYRGRYSPFIKRYFGTFGKEAVHVYTTGELRDDRAGTMAAIARHLGLDPKGLPARTGDGDGDRNVFRVARNPVADWIATSRGIRLAAQKLIPYGIRRRLLESMMAPADKPTLEPEAARILTDLYRDDVEQVEALVGRRLPELRASFVED